MRRTDLLVVWNLGVRCTDMSRIEEDSYLKEAERNLSRLVWLYC